MIGMSQEQARGTLNKVLSLSVDILSSFLALQSSHVPFSGGSSIRSRPEFKPYSFLNEQYGLASLGMGRARTSTVAVAYIV